MSQIRKTWEESILAIEDHWADCEENGLPHTSENLQALVRIIDAYVTDLEAVANSNDQQILSTMEKLYADLNSLNEKFDMGLLETDERELLVPIIVNLAVAAGIDADKYDGEPGGEFRDF